MELISTQQAAEKLGVNDSRVRQMVRAGQLPAQQVGRAYLINVADLALVAGRKPGRPPKQVNDSPGEADVNAAETTADVGKDKRKPKAKKATRRKA